MSNRKPSPRQLEHNAISEAWPGRVEEYTRLYCAKCQHNRLGACKYGAIPVNRDGGACMNFVKAGGAP